MFLAIPGHIIFLVTICSAESLGFPSVLFVLFYLIAALCQVPSAKFSVCMVIYGLIMFQVAVLLYLCQVLVYSMWSRGMDPDNAAIPYLTAFGDFLGSAFLVFSFLLLKVVRDSFLEDIEAGAGLVHGMMENVTLSDGVINLI